jgi:succinate dehydrogenase flavoprotein subunit
VQALDELAQLKERLARVTVQGNRQYNPGWHLALDLHHMLAVAESITRSAIERKESRGGHTRDDFPATDPHFGRVNVVTRRTDDGIAVCQEPLPEIPDELKAIIEEKN